MGQKHLRHSLIDLTRRRLLEACCALPFSAMVTGVLAQADEFS